MGVLIIHCAGNMCDGLRFEVKIKEANSDHKPFFSSGEIKSITA